VPRDNPLYTDAQKALFKCIPGLARAYRLKLAYNWESEAFKLEGGEKAEAIRGQVEAFFLAHMKATAPEKYHDKLTPHYPVSLVAQADMPCRALVLLTISAVGLQAPGI
jgi:hypothetical protein